MAFGASLRGGMDAKMQAGVTRLLLQALVPAVIFRSLSSISVSAELASFVAGGAALVLLQVRVRSDARRPTCLPPSSSSTGAVPSSETGDDRTPPHHPLRRVRKQIVTTLGTSNREANNGRGAPLRSPRSRTERRNGAAERSGGTARRNGATERSGGTARRNGATERGTERRNRATEPSDGTERRNGATERSGGTERRNGATERSD